MSSYVEIVLQRNRGWPWPEDSWGLSPMFGEDGWCRSCGVPKHPQSGSIVLQKRGLTVEGGWVPNWQFDVYCLARDLANGAADRFGLELRPVASAAGPSLPAGQIIIASSRAAWFDPRDLTRLISPIHGVAFETCQECGTTRWLPVGMDVLPMPPTEVVVEEPPVIASPERFGAGKQSFRQILWRRDVAEFLAAASPKDFQIQDSA